MAHTLPDTCKCACGGMNHGVDWRRQNGLLRFAEEEAPVAQYLLNVTVDKYTVRQHHDGSVVLLRNGQRWGAAVDYPKAWIAYGCEVEALREQVAELQAKLKPAKKKVRTSRGYRTDALAPRKGHLP